MQIFEATPDWMTPTPKPPHPDPILTPLLPRFRPEFDHPIFTSWGDLVSKLGQIQVEIGSEGGGVKIGSG